MKVTVRQLNALGNVLKAEGKIKMAKRIHEKVLFAVERGITEINLPTDTPDQKKFVWLIKNADKALKEKL